MLHRATLIALAFAYALPTLSQPVLGQSQLPVKRWAILSDTSVQQSGLEQLLFAELANSEMELVERSGLEAVADELTIKSLVGGNSGERSRIGKLLHADALIIISTAAGTTKVTLCECRQGVRLASIRSTIDNAAIQAKQLADAILAVGKQFTDGVQLVIGVSPFACRNIQHDFDHLQNQYFDILSSRLLLSPGVTLIEMEEARAMLREFGAGIDADQRVLPVLLDADYKVDDATVPLTVQIAAKLTSGTATEQLDISLTIDRAGEWISSDLAQKILDRSKLKNKLLTIEEQKTALEKRAEVFQTLGDVRNAIRCREALLVIDPLNVEQRLQLIAEFQGFVEEIDRSLPSGSSRARSDAQVAEEAMRLLLVLEHFSFLIENRLVDRAQAVQCLSQMASGMPGGIDDGPSVMVQYCFASETTRPLMEALISANRRFVFEVAPKILKLKINTRLTLEEDIREQIEWQDNVMLRVNRDVLLHGGSMESLEYLEQVVRRVIPEALPTSAVVTRMLGICTQNYKISAAPVRANAAFGQREEAVFGPPEADFLIYLKRISQSHHPHLQLYARLTLLHREDLQAKPASQVVPKYKALLADLERRPFSQLTNSSGTYLDGVVRTARTCIIARQGTSNQTPPAPPVQTSLGRLQFENLNADFGTFGSQPFQWINCDGKFDLLADSQHVAIMRAPGELETIIDVTTSKLLPISQCEWDGKQIWLVHKAGDLVVFDTGGKLLTQVDRTAGLPVHDQDLQVFPVQPNLALVYGRHGPDKRCWLAIIELQDNRAKVDVIFEARKAIDQAARLTVEKIMAMERDIHLSFQPSWFGVCMRADSLHAYIGRSQSPFPLVVDLKSRKVTLSESFGRSAHEPFRNTLKHSLVCVDDRMFKAFSTGVFHFESPQNSPHPKLISEDFITSIQPVQSSDPLVLSGTTVTWDDPNPTLLQMDDWIYKPGEVWYRFRPDSLEIERLVPTRLPQEFSGLEYGVSSQYGLVGWKANGAIYKIQVR